MPAPLEIKVFAIDQTWTAIHPPFPCSNIFMKNTGSQPLLLRTDSGDIGTQDSIAAGGGQSMGQASAYFRFVEGAAAFYAAVGSGVGQATIYFMV